MIPLRKIPSTTVGRKYLMGLTGIGLVVFVITHLLGNLYLYRSESTWFNSYAAKLEGLGGILYVLEAGLLLTFLIHIVTALRVKKENVSARGPVGYRAWRSKGGPTHANAQSRNMFWTGAVLLVFLLIHIPQFKFGPGAKMGYETEINGEMVRDLHRLVVETFQSPLWVTFYVACMVFLGFHLRHGFWSAFQSLGTMNRRTHQAMYFVGLVIALILAAGFLFIPIWIYFGLNGAVQ
jgi:succinate dehydrogenase / fumarate reductase, cytochrome b subunit